MITLTGNGRLTRDVTVRTTHSGKTVATISIASDRRDRDADPVYLDLIVWQTQATAAAEHLVKARPSASPDASRRASTSPTPARTGSRSSCTAWTSNTGPSRAATTPATRSPQRPARPILTTSRSEPPQRAGRRTGGPPPAPTHAQCARAALPSAVPRRGCVGNDG